MKMPTSHTCWNNGIIDPQHWKGPNAPWDPVLPLSFYPFSCFISLTNIFLEGHPASHNLCSSAGQFIFGQIWVAELYYLHSARINLLSQPTSMVSFLLPSNLSSKCLPFLLRLLASFQVHGGTKFFAPFLFLLLDMLISSVHLAVMKASFRSKFKCHFLRKTFHESNN